MGRLKPWAYMKRTTPFSPRPKALRKPSVPPALKACCRVRMSSGEVQPVTSIWILTMAGTAEVLAADPEARKLYLGEKFKLDRY